MKMRHHFLILCVLCVFLIMSCDVSINQAGRMYFYPRDLNFGSVNAGDEKELVLEIDNPGVADLVLDEIFLVPDQFTSDQEMYISQAFNYAGEEIELPLENVKVKKDELIKIVFIFKPIDALAKSATLSIIHNAGNFETPLEKVITGNSSSLTITPQTLDFGKVNSTKTLEKQINILNSSQEAIKVYSINLSGSTDYKIQSNSGFSTLNPSQSRTVKVSFTPSITGLIEATLSINHDSSGSPTVVSITGIGVPDENRAPSVRNASVDPGIVKGDGSETVLFTAEIDDDNGFADVKSVKIDMSGLNGDSNQLMFDDGTNGDLTPDDKVFSFQYQVPSGLTPKSYEITITAADYSEAQGTGICYLRIYSGNKIYVSDEKGNDTSGNGSINAPYKTIQKGIDSATTGDWVVVQDGTYKGTGNIDLNFAHGLPSTKNREIILQSENGAGTTIIDCEGSNGNRHRGFSFTSNETNSSVVDGFTIINGYTTANGGAIVIDGASPTIQNCVISSCYADNNGGGISCANDSKAVIINNVISNNGAKSGAGIFAYNGIISVINNNIIGNTGTTNGAGICIDGKQALISGNNVSNNELSSSVMDLRGAGVYVKGFSSTPTIVNNNIKGNYMRGDSGDCKGAGLYLEVSTTVYDVNNNNIESNTIHCNTESSFGGGVYISGEGTQVKFFDNTVTLNESYTSEAKAFGGGIYVDGHTKPEIKFNTVSYNLAKSRANVVYGGGIYLKATNASIFTDNSVVNNSAVSISNYCYGCGIYVGKPAAHLDVKNSDFSRNEGSVPPGQRIYGGGVFVEAESVVLLENCDISENYLRMASYLYGGGVYVDNNSNVTITDSRINSNKLEAYYYSYGCGIYCAVDTNVSIVRSEIEKNTIIARYDGYGCGIYYRQGSFSIVNSSISNNTLNCWRYAYGGGIYYYNHLNLKITACEITDNTNYGSTCYGGGLYGYYNSATAEVNNTLIANNTLDSTNIARGGAFYSYYSIFTFNNCTITRNESISDTGTAHGGSIYIYYTYLNSSCNNTLFWDNNVLSRFGAGSPDGHEFYIELDRNYIIILNNCLLSKLAKNGIESLHDPYSMISPNLACIYDKDPYFVDPEAQNYHLQHTNIGSLNNSPAIDKGNNSLLPAGITKDLDGNSRFVDGLKNGGYEIDLGCYEKQN